MLAKLTRTLAVASAVACIGTASAADDSIQIAAMMTLTGPSSDSGVFYAQGIQDTVDYINANGGINGRQLDMPMEDYGYEIPRAVSAYKKWQASIQPVVIQGWGTPDTEAMVPFITKDHVVYMSASYSGHLTDPTGESEHAPYAAPYNFFYGPTYSDQCRAMAEWAMQDWEESGNEGQPIWIHMGADHPYSKAPKPACTEWAKDLGFEIVSSIQFPMEAGDYKSQCLALQKTDADYAYLGNTITPNVSLMKSCESVGVDVQFLANIYGWDENAVRASGSAGEGTIFPVTAGAWTSDAPGMETMREVSAMSDDSGEKYRAVHYLRAACSVFFMRDAMLMVDEQGKEMTSENVKAALESMEEHVPDGLEGVCVPETWTPTSHRGSVDVKVYQSHLRDDEVELDHVYTAHLPRGEEFLGW